MRCPICDVEHGNWPVAGEVSSRLCGSARCLRRFGWDRATPERRHAIAGVAGVGVRFRPDGVLPSLALSPYPDCGYSLKGSCGVLLVGPVGTGKTWALAAIVCEALARGQTALLLPWADLQLAVQSTYRKDSAESSSDLIARLAGLDVLAIDDLGSGKDVGGGVESEAARSLCCTLLDRRYANCKATHVATNLRPADLATRYDDRIGRRLGELCRTVVMHKPAAEAVADKKRAGAGDDEKEGGTG